MTERVRSRSYSNSAKMANDLSPRKTMVVLVIVVGCFAVLWPKVFYPMLVGSANQHMKPSPIDKTTGCCDVISETDVNTIKIMSELCSTIIKEDEGSSLTGREIVAKCRTAVLETCGIDISAVLQEQVRLGQTVKQILDEVRSLNGSLCLKYNFGVAPWRLGVPHRVTLKVSPSSTIRQERPQHLRSELIHPAFKERGRAIPQSQTSLPSRPTPRIVEGKPGPIPGMRRAMGGAGHVVHPKQSTSSMSLIMPIYTVAIVIFFLYTVMKVVFKKQPEALYPPVESDPNFRKEVFESERSHVGPKLTRDSVSSKLVVNAMTALLDEVDQEIESRRKPSEVADQDFVANGNIAATQEEEQPSVKVLGMEMRASCEGGKKWTQPDSPAPVVSSPPAPEPPQEIFLEGALPPQSHLLVANSATEAQKTNSEEDPAVVLAGKMTLSVISLDSSENGTDESSNSIKKQEGSSSNVSEEFERIDADADLEDQIDGIIDQAQAITGLVRQPEYGLLEDIQREMKEIDDKSEITVEPENIVECLKNNLTLNEDFIDKEKIANVEQVAAEQFGGEVSQDEQQASATETEVQNEPNTEKSKSQEQAVESSFVTIEQLGESNIPSEQTPGDQRGDAQAPVSESKIISDLNKEEKLTYQTRSEHAGTADDLKKPLIETSYVEGEKQFEEKPPLNLTEIYKPSPGDDISDISPQSDIETVPVGKQQETCVGAKASDRQEEVPAKGKEPETSENLNEATEALASDFQPAADNSQITFSKMCEELLGTPKYVVETLEAVVCDWQPEDTKEQPPVEATGQKNLDNLYAPIEDFSPKSKPEHVVEEVEFETVEALVCDIEPKKVEEQPAIKDTCEKTFDKLYGEVPDFFPEPKPTHVVKEEEFLTVEAVPVDIQPKDNEQHTIPESKPEYTVKEDELLTEEALAVDIQSESIVEDLKEKVINKLYEAVEDFSSEPKSDYSVKEEEVVLIEALACDAQPEGIVEQPAVEIGGEQRFDKLYEVIPDFSPEPKPKEELKATEALIVDVQPQSCKGTATIVDEAVGDISHDSKPEYVVKEEKLIAAEALAVDVQPQSHKEQPTIEDIEQNEVKTSCDSSLDSKLEYVVKEEKLVVAEAAVFDSQPEVTKEQLTSETPEEKRVDELSEPIEVFFPDSKPEYTIKEQELVAAEALAIEIQPEGTKEQSAVADTAEKNSRKLCETSDVSHDSKQKHIVEEEKLVGVLLADNEVPEQELEFEYEGSESEEADDEIRNVARGDDSVGNESVERVNGDDQEQSKYGTTSSATLAENEISDEDISDEDDEIEVQEIIEYVTDDEEEIDELIGPEPRNVVNHVNERSGARE